MKTSVKSACGLLVNDNTGVEMYISEDLRRRVVDAHQGEINVEKSSKLKAFPIMRKLLLSKNITG